MKKLQKEIIKQRFDETSFEPLEEFKSTNQKIKIRCKKCLNIDMAYPSQIFNKSYLCKYCKHSDKKKIKENESCIGIKIGKLTVIAEDKSGNGNGRIWLAKCECGNTTRISTSSINSSAKKSCGCLKKNNLVGEKYHRLLVIEQGYNLDNIKSRILLCRVKCDCGKEKIVYACKLRRGDIQSCGCIIGQKKRKTKGEASRNAVYSKYIRSAKQRSIIFNLTYDDCIRLFEGKCYYCGKEPSNCYQEKNCYGNYKYNGIDRLDSNTGYIKNNCVSCCWECNKRKSNSNYKDFIDWIEKVYNYHVKKEN